MNPGTEPVPPVPPEPPGPVMPGPPADISIYIILGFISAVLSFLCCPWLFGIIAIALGLVAYRRGNPLGMWVIIIGAAGLIIGTVIGAIIGNRVFRGMPSTGTSPWTR